MKTLLDLNEAAAWASEFTKKEVTPANISYLIQYGKVKKYTCDGKTCVCFDELKKYYEEYYSELYRRYKERLGNDINWVLSFAHVKEKERTKHVHRLHPYKGKFIPQLVEYFLDNHTDSLKQEVYFRPGDVILDPFAGSGTTLVQAAELGIHSIGVDISGFNCLIAEAKLLSYDLEAVAAHCRAINGIIKSESSELAAFERELSALIASINREFFPSPEFKYRLERGEVDEESVVSDALASLKEGYGALLKKYNVQLKGNLTGSQFLDTWLAAPVIREALAVREYLKRMYSENERKLLTVVLSRTIRSCRLTPHYQLESLDKPVYEPYYCYKHMKICRPIISMARIFSRYSKDTIKRLEEFSMLKKDTFSLVINGDSRHVNIFEEVRKRSRDFYNLLLSKRIRGIFTSPPYVGQLDYHAQHEYAYEFFGLSRQDAQEIGNSSKGKGNKAREEYIEGIAAALINCKKYLADGFHIFIVANDEYGLYPRIAERAGLRIVKEFKRPVLNRTSRDRNPYGESIFLMAEK
ncbi:MAG: DNA methyltransferase [Thermacetogeniaceae bacterium]